MRIPLFSSELSSSEKDTKDTFKFISNQKRMSKLF